MKERFLLMVSCLAFAFADAKLKRITLVGPVVDTGCYLVHDGVDHKHPNTLLMPFTEKKVKVTGTQVQRGGLTGSSIKTVEATK